MRGAFASALETMFAALSDGVYQGTLRGRETYNPETGASTPAAAATVRVMFTAEPMRPGEPSRAGERMVQALVPVVDVATVQSGGTLQVGTTTYRIGQVTKDALAIAWRLEVQET